MHALGIKTTHLLELRVLNLSMYYLCQPYKELKDTQSNNPSSPLR